MPYYKYADDYICKDHQLLDDQHAPNYLAPQDGIYACEWCGFEVVLKARDSFPDAESCGFHSAEWHPPPDVRGFNRAKWRLVALPIRQSGLL
jgi:hypothetical protein